MGNQGKFEGRAGDLFSPGGRTDKAWREISELAFRKL